MKKTISILLMIIVLWLMSVCSSAIDISRLPLVPNRNCDYMQIEKNINLKANLVINESDILVIPKGKKIVLNGNNSITVNGKLYIEHGGNLIVNSGTLILNKGATVLSNGSINIRDNGTLKMLPNANFTVLPEGILLLDGQLDADLKTSNIECLGNYVGQHQGVKAEIISAVSFVTTAYNEKLEGFASYERDAAQNLFPKEILINKSQKRPIGGVITTVRFFCSNGQILEVVLYGSLSGYNSVLMNGIIFIK